MDHISIKFLKRMFHCESLLSITLAKIQITQTTTPWFVSGLGPL